MVLAGPSPHPHSAKSAYLDGGVRGNRSLKIENEIRLMVKMPASQDAVGLKSLPKFVSHDIYSVARVVWDPVPASQPFSSFM